MTNQLEGEALSMAVAEAYDISKGSVHPDTPSKDGSLRWRGIWLHEESARCFELAVDNCIRFFRGRKNTDPFIKAEYSNIFHEKYKRSISEVAISDDAHQAARTAILRCLLAMREK